MKPTNNHHALETKIIIFNVILKIRTKNAYNRTNNVKLALKNYKI